MALQMQQRTCLQRRANGGAARSVAQVAPLSRRRAVTVRAGTLAPGDLVLVAGATGGVGQLVTAKLLERGFKVRALTRSRNSEALKDYGPNCEVVPADLREAAQLPRLFEGGVKAVVCATGTTAFPSARWKNDNGPRQTDLVATSNLINAAKNKGLARFVYITSAGVMRQGSPPWSILNAFGVLKFKRQSEELLEGSGIPFTILRPSRLTDGPYTSYDLNTLLKATAGGRRDITLSLSDSLSGEASRIACAEAVVQALQSRAAENKAFAIASKEGDGPGTDTSRWEQLFASARA